MRYRNSQHREEDAKEIRSEALSLLAHSPRRIKTRSKLTEERARVICEHLAAGGKLKAACALAGIDGATYAKWMREGSRVQEAAIRSKDYDLESFTEEQRRCAAFVPAVSNARAQAEEWAISVLRAATDPLVDEKTGRVVRHGDWRSAAFLLERGQPKEWGPKAEVSHSGEVVERRRIVIERREGARARIEGQGDEGRSSGADIGSSDDAPQLETGEKGS